MSFLMENIHSGTETNRYRHALETFFSEKLPEIKRKGKFNYLDSFWLYMYQKHLKDPKLSDDELESMYRELCEILKRNKIEIPLLYS